MSGRDSPSRSLVVSVARSRQVHVEHAVSPMRDGADTAPKPAPRSPRSGAGSNDDTDVAQHRRSIAQIVGVIALIAGAWAFLVANDSSVMRSDLGSDAGGMTSERAVIVEVLEGVVGLVDAEHDGEVGDQGAEFGAGEGPPGRPPAPPSVIGRNRSGPAGTTPVGIAASPPGSPGDPDDRNPEAGPGPAEPARTEPAPGSPTIAPDPGAAGAVSSPSTASSTATTVGSSTTTTRSSSTTTTPGSSTTGEPPATAAEVTTSSAHTTCVVVVSRPVKLWDAPRSGNEIGRLEPGTHHVLERFGAKWYRVSGGWIRDTGRVTPESC